jgi:hypothetical protein
VRKWLESHVTHHLTLNQGTVGVWLNSVEMKFPLSRGMGRAIRETLAFMRSNIAQRMQVPFFELDIIERLYGAGEDGFQAEVDRIMATHGICSGRQERHGAEDEIERDVLFAFSVIGKDDLLNESRFVMQASFEFLSRHFQLDGSFRPTVAARGGKCPFFASCAESTRLEHASDCASQPWQAVVTRPDNPCRYAAGVRETGRGGDALAGDSGA